MSRIGGRRLQDASPVDAILLGREPGLLLEPDVRTADLLDRIEAELDPEARQLPLDSHLHTDISHDADVPIDLYAALARRRGILEIAITDHLDFDARDPNFAAADYERRLRQLREVAERWDGRPLVRFGVEITYEARLEEEIRSYLNRHPYDFVIGSVHVSERTPLHPRAPELAAEWCRGRTHLEASAWYWDDVEAAIRSELFDTLGHLDFVKRYLLPHLGPFRYEPHAAFYDRLLGVLVETGMALEVNSSGLRQGVGEAYPGPEVVARFRQLGGTRVSAGSDSHRVRSFGWALARAYGSIRDAGFETLAFRRGGEPLQVPLGIGE